MNNLAEEIRQIWVEKGFDSRMTVIEMYHEIGKLILSQRDANIQSLSVLSGIQERQLQRAVQFAKKFPDLALLPEGKNISWHSIVNKYLPEHSSTLTEKTDPEAGKVMVTCPACGHQFSPNDLTKR
jgi:hypothetical protein